MSDPVLVSLRDHVLTIRLNRPERRNALNRAAYHSLTEAFARVQDDGAVRCVIVTGADPAFCSGDDVGEIMVAEAGARQTRARRGRPAPTPAALAALACEVPVIAAVNGPAMGWGMDLSLFCDIRIASERARFSELFIKRGLIPDLGGLWRLPAIVGPARAAELVFTGKVIDANEALAIGLVSRVVAHDALMAEAEALAAEIAANPPTALRYAKEGLRLAQYGDPIEIGAYVHRALRELFETEDHREGVRAFLEKRPPVFGGR